MIATTSFKSHSFLNSLHAQTPSHNLGRREYKYKKTLNTICIKSILIFNYHHNCRTVIEEKREVIDNMLNNVAMSFNMLLIKSTKRYQTLKHFPVIRELDKTSHSTNMLQHFLHVFTKVRIETSNK